MKITSVYVETADSCINNLNIFYLIEINDIKYISVNIPQLLYLEIVNKTVFPI